MIFSHMLNSEKCWGEMTMKKSGGYGNVKPYKGEEKYIFISYAHKDYDKIKDIIADMCDNGYRVWFDEAIDPGTEWDENIAEHIKKAHCVIAFISKNYLDSENCKDEINYARDLQKERLLIYIEDVNLPSGMAMRMNRLQAIKKYSNSDSDFFEKLYEVEFIAKCCEDGAEAVSFDGYKVIERIKSTGMAKVYKAIDTNTDTVVAIKKYSVYEAFGSLLFSKRGFADELKRLDSPRICKLFKVVSGDEPFAVMQYIDGQQLGQYVYSNNLSERQILNLMKQVLEALEIIHSHEMLYVDISPYNIMVSHGEICLVDLDGMTFSGSKFDTIITSITRYNCPERYVNNNMDYRSDIYATGMLLNDLTLKREDVGYNEFQCVDGDSISVKYDEPVKQGIFEIISKATKKAPDERYQSVSEMIDDINKLLG